MKNVQCLADHSSPIEASIDVSREARLGHPMAMIMILGWVVAGPNVSVTWTVSELVVVVTVGEGGGG
jgi:hypothetical protein